jgi:lysyl-tRNA synthetase class 1
MLNDEEKIHLKQRVDCVRFWLDGFAPEKVKFSIAEEAPEMEISPEQRSYMQTLAQKLNEEEWTPDAIHNTIYDLAQSQGLKSKNAFQLVYQAILNQKYGPRLGYFLSTLDREFIVKRIEDVAK